MVRGRKPLPTALRMVKGERPDRINDDEPQPDEGVPECPSEVHKVRAIWDYTVAQLQRMRVVTMADRDILLTYCEAVNTYNQMTRRLQTEGLITEDPRTGALRAHPAVKIQRDAAAQIKALGTEFGLTPASRTRIKVADQTPKDQGQSASRLLSG